jgi:choline kinase
VTNNNSDHQVIILAAGRSLRLSRLTQDRPKSLLVVAGEPILGHSLNILSRRGFKRLTLVVGYLREQFVEQFGTRYKNIDIEYVTNEAYADSEHGWSLYCARHSWARDESPVVFMDADNLYDPMMLDKIMGCGFDDVMLVDENLNAEDRDEELVIGRGDVVTGLRRGRIRDYPDFAGGFVGINRFSPAFMGRLFAFMDEFFDRKGKMQKYERVFDALINETGVRVHYLESRGLPSAMPGGPETHPEPPGTRHHPKAW